jgi:hypothetical protein
LRRAHGAPLRVPADLRARRRRRGLARDLGRIEAR